MMDYGYFWINVPPPRYLTKEEWIIMVKQLGLMPVLYAVRRRFSRMKLWKSLRATTIEDKIFEITNTEDKFYGYFDCWEKDYKRGILK